MRMRNCYIVDDNEQRTTIVDLNGSCSVETRIIAPYTSLLKHHNEIVAMRRFENKEEALNHHEEAASLIHTDGGNVYMAALTESDPFELDILH